MSNFFSKCRARAACCVLWSTQSAPNRKGESPQQGKSFTHSHVFEFHFVMDHSQSCFSICSLLGALKNTTPSSGEMSLLDKSSAQKKEVWEKPHNYTKSWPFSYSLCAIIIMCNYVMYWVLYLPTFNIRAQLQLCHLSLQEGIDSRKVLCSSVGQQHCVDAVQVTDQLPKASL